MNHLVHFLNPKKTLVKDIKRMTQTKGGGGRRYSGIRVIDKGMETL